MPKHIHHNQTGFNYRYGKVGHYMTTNSLATSQKWTEKLVYKIKSIDLMWQNQASYNEVSKR